jgi:hypothetical protein
MKQAIFKSWITTLIGIILLAYIPYKLYLDASLSIDTVFGMLVALGFIVGKDGNATHSRPTAYKSVTPPPGRPKPSQNPESVTPPPGRPKPSQKSGSVTPPPGRPKPSQNPGSVTPPPGRPKSPKPPKPFKP